MFFLGVFLKLIVGGASAVICLEVSVCTCMYVLREGRAGNNLRCHSPVGTHPVFGGRVSLVWSLPRLDWWSRCPWDASTSTSTLGLQRWDQWVLVGELKSKCLKANTLLTEPAPQRYFKYFIRSDGNWSLTQGLFRRLFHWFPQKCCYYCHYFVGFWGAVCSEAGSHC